ncbi:MAG TPA: DNA topoisomerase IB [Candidatus Dormibacteraeota bacterium]|nr:DNA topoisomerase IB [Candidatus Dormibacteraeota bacterium]
MKHAAPPLAQPPTDPVESAHIVGLRYVSDHMPGITREHAGKTFRFRFPTGSIVHEAEVLRRIKALAIPPAWKEVWICPDLAGHLQATGRDERGRKQFRYHPRWREIRDETKYTRMIAFARALPRIRRRVFQDLKLSGLPRNKVLATVVRLLEVSLIRVGNEEYARENESFGLTTMRDRHVDVYGSKLRFHFRGKSGKWHDVDVRDKRLAKIVQSCQELPGHELFQYVDENGERKAVDSHDVNEYLKEISGADFTAKDFRTWAGTILGAMALQEFEQFETQTQAKKNIVKAIESVASRLGNTPAVCRKCYVHPDVINSYLDGTLAETLKQKAEKTLSRSLHKLRPEEAAVLALLRQRLVDQRKRNQPLPVLLKRSLRAAGKQRHR